MCVDTDRRYEVSDEHEAPRRLTPTERAHEITIAALSRKPVTASEEVEITRNAKGDYQYRIQGVVGEEETLTALANRVLDVAYYYDEKMPLSRKQEFDRKYLPDEKGK